MCRPKPPIVPLNAAEKELLTLLRREIAGDKDSHAAGKVIYIQKTIIIIIIFVYLRLSNATIHTTASQLTHELIRRELTNKLHMIRFVVVQHVPCCTNSKQIKVMQFGLSSITSICCYSKQ